MWLFFLSQKLINASVERKRENKVGNVTEDETVDVKTDLIEGTTCLQVKIGASLR